MVLGELVYQIRMPRGEIETYIDGKPFWRKMSLTDQAKLCDLLGLKVIHFSQAH